MTGYIDQIGGEVFLEADFQGKNYIVAIPRLATAIKRHVAQAWNGVSTTSNTIGSGVDKTFTVLTLYGSPPAFEGQPRVRISVLGSAANFMWGNVNSFDPLTGVTQIAIDKHGGSGTHANWVFTIAGADGAATGVSDTLTFLTIGDESSAAGNSRRLGARYGNRLNDLGAGNFGYVEAETKPATVSGTTYTQLQADRGALLQFKNAAGCAVTALRPHDSSGAPNNAPTGLLTWIDAEGGPVTITPSTGTFSANGVSGQASFLFPKGSLGFIESAGGDVWLAHIVRHARSLIEVTGDTTIDRSHAGTLVAINSATQRTMTLPQTDALGVGVSFEIEFQAVTGFHSIARAGSNVFDKSGGATSVALIEGQGIKLRSNGGSGAAGIWVTQRGGPGQLNAEPQYFLSSGTWNLSSLPPWAKGVVVEVDGGGGSGGAGRTSDSQRGGGGAGGGRSIKFIPRASLGTTETVTVAGTAAGVTAGASPSAGNTGGTSSFGAHCSATGGQGGVAANGAVQAGVAGGSGSGGDVNLTGGDAPLSFPDGASSGGGRGGNSAAGGQGGATNVGAPGLRPGGGGAAGNHTASAVSGTGAPGLVKVTPV